MSESKMDVQFLITSNEWRHWLKVVEEHKQYLQREVNKFIRRKEWTEAFGAVSKLDDIDKQVNLLLKTLNKEKDHA